MGYLLFNADFNWADEMDIEEFYLANKSSREAKILSEVSLGLHVEKLVRRDICVGTNQDVPASEVARSLVFHEITDEEAKFLMKVGIGNNAHAIERLYEICEDEEFLY